MYLSPRGCDLRQYVFQWFFDNYMRIDKLTEDLSTFEYKQCVRFLVKINL